MKNPYVFVPLAGLVLFGGGYWSYSIQREAALAALQEKAAAARREQTERTQAALAASRAAAATATAERAQARLAREQHEAAEKAAQAAAEQRRTHAFEHERKLRSQLDRRRAEVARATASLAVLERRQKELADESTFLADYLDRAEPNRETYYRLLEKIEATEKARASSPATVNPSPSANR
jgi:hypothetical protein